MAFSKLAFFPITAEDDNGVPTYGSLTKLYDGELTNNISCELTPTNVTRTRKADDVVSEEEKMQSYDMRLTVYGIDLTAFETIIGYKKDGNNNIVIEPNKAKTKFGVFYETVDENNNKRQQIYLSKVVAGNILPSAATDEKGDPVSKEINFKGSLIRVNGVDKVGFIVDEDNTGFIASGMPETMYTEVELNNA